MLNRTEVARWVLIGTILSSSGARLAAAQELHVDGGKSTVVRFISRTQLAEFEGVTERIDGYVVLGGRGLAMTHPSETDLYFEVDLASIDTGIGLRNRHMRDNYLEVEKYPYASFAGRIARTEFGKDGAARVVAQGAFTVHGVTRPHEIPCEVAPSDEGYRATCAFLVRLSDHAIEIPNVMFLELANEIDVRVEFTVSPAADPRENRS